VRAGRGVGAADGGAAREAALGELRAKVEPPKAAQTRAARRVLRHANSFASSDDKELFFFDALSSHTPTDGDKDDESDDGFADARSLAGSDDGLDDGSSGAPDEDESVSDDELAARLVQGRWREMYRGKGYSHLTVAGRTNLAMLDFKVDEGKLGGRWRDMGLYFTNCREVGRWEKPLPAGKVMIAGTEWLCDESRTKAQAAAAVDDETKVEWSFETVGENRMLAWPRSPMNTRDMSSMFVKCFKTTAEECELLAGAWHRSYESGLPGNVRAIFFDCDKVDNTVIASYIKESGAASHAGQAVPLPLGQVHWRPDVEGWAPDAKRWRFLLRRLSVPSIFLEVMGRRGWQYRGLFFKAPSPDD